MVDRLYEVYESAAALDRHVDQGAALARFERLVLAQQPATTPWRPVTDYSFEARQQIEGIHPQLIKDVFQPTRVLDVGCGFGHLVRLLIEAGIPHVQGCELGPQRGCSWFFSGDIATSDFAFYFNVKGRDLVICREVLEHLTVLQIRRAVPNLCALSSKFVYVTTRFAKAPTSLLDVDTADDLDPTHISMLHQDFLRVLFVLEGFRRRADLEARMDHHHKGRVLVYERAA